MKLTVSGQDMSGEATVYLMLVPRAGVRLQNDVPVALTFEALPGAAGDVRLDAMTEVHLSDAPPPGTLVFLPGEAEKVFFINTAGPWKLTFRETP
ncbi:hypothetical protein HOT99_gp050 [Caulobacter phage CcrBL10]|uniref:Uncharacterized protein n=1 Tax=Caulobacter phage CcrBL10 TaxID=2283269 RepID=A0A385E8V0_9CAUD|nr:hypothetical protein HOT99_gp050 [Caulobacter phage CcrBL10]AXQ68254.1 hypothetical protein CcrBL10_gp050 [Caulobacter phage CcrBL10]